MMNCQCFENPSFLPAFANFSTVICFQTFKQLLYLLVIFVWEGECKGEEIANAGYLENVASFCESYNLF